MLSAYLHESWLSDDITDSYMIMRLDRNRHGGGVTLFISNVMSHFLLATISLNVSLSPYNLGHVSFVFVCFTDQLTVVSSSDVLDDLFNFLCSLDTPLFVTSS